MSPRVSAAWILLASSLFAAPAPPPFSLSDDAVPRKYSIELTLDPNKDTYDGLARIEIELLKKSPVIWLNATGLTILEARVETVQRTIPVHATPQPADLLAIEPESPATFDKGHVTLTLRYRATLPDKPIIGPYRLKFEDNWYIFTTFTPNGARSAFPCFDQPRFKTPWTLRIRPRRDYKAFSNTRASRETDQPGGMKLVEFDTTVPLSSEIIAFAAGPLDTYTQEPCGEPHIPVRIITPQGRASDAEEAACATPGLLAKLESYTGIPFPYEKLDHVAIPELPFGAVENVGLITYRLRALLFPAGRA